MREGEGGFEDEGLGGLRRNNLLGGEGEGFVLRCVCFIF